MNKLISAAVLAMSLSVVGCGAKSGTPPTAPTTIPNAANPADSAMFQTLTALHAFAKRMSDDANSGKFTPTPTQKNILNQLIADLNASDLLYTVYHSAAITGTATPAQEKAVQESIDKAKSDQASYTSTVTAGGK